MVFWWIIVQGFNCVSNTFVQYHNIDLVSSKNVDIICHKIALKEAKWSTNNTIDVIPISTHRTTQEAAQKQDAAVYKRRLIQSALRVWANDALVVGLQRSYTIGENSTMFKNSNEQSINQYHF